MAEHTDREKLLVAIALSVGAMLYHHEGREISVLDTDDGIRFAVAFLLGVTTADENHDLSADTIALNMLDAWEKHDG